MKGRGDPKGYILSTPTLALPHPEGEGMSIQLRTLSKSPFKQTPAKAGTLLIGPG